MVICEGEEAWDLTPALLALRKEQCEGAVGLARHEVERGGSEEGVCIVSARTRAAH